MHDTGCPLPPLISRRPGRLLQGPASRPPTPPWHPVPSSFQTPSKPRAGQTPRAWQDWVTREQPGHAHACFLRASHPADPSGPPTPRGEAGQQPVFQSRKQQLGRGLHREAVCKAKEGCARLLLDQVEEEGRAARLPRGPRAPGHRARLVPHSGPLWSAHFAEADVAKVGPHCPPPGALSYGTSVLAILSQCQADRGSAERGSPAP